MTDSTQRTMLAEGKTKIIWDEGNDTVLIESKDDITAGDGASHDLLEGKAVAATETTSRVFELLHSRNIATHYRGPVNQRTFRARRVDMIPLELVARRIATGSYLKRHPDVAEGTVFALPMIEFFEKDDPNHDPLVIIDLVSRRLLRYQAGKPLAEGFIGEQRLANGRFQDLFGSTVQDLAHLTENVFIVLEVAWAKQGVTLVDLKIECGWDRETKKLIVADVIDNDSWRIWPGGDKDQMRDKQVYRDLAGVEDPAARAKELGKIKEDYAWVAQQTGNFLAN